MSSCGAMPKTGGAKKHVPLDDPSPPNVEDMGNDFNPANMGGKRRRKGGNETPAAPVKTSAPGGPLSPPPKKSAPGAPTTPAQGGRRITRRAHWRYIRGMKIRVPAKKIKDMGAKGKWASLHGPGIGELKPGGLMGYSPSMSKTARRTKLRKVVKSKGALTTFRKLNALSTYTKRTAKGKSKTAKADRNWVKKTYM